MKPRLRLIIYAAALVLLVVIFLNMPQLTPCSRNPPASDQQQWFRPDQIVVQPWKGPHHVYGIFSVPERYKQHRLYSVRLVISGLTDELPETSPDSGSIYGSDVEVGQYLMRMYLPTRIALWMLLTGRFGDLKAPCHWWLVVFGRVNQMSVQ